MELANMKSENNSVLHGRQQETKIDISIPGLGRLTDPTYGKKKKVLWMVVVITCAITCAYLTTNRLVHYFDVPTASKVFVKIWTRVTFPSFTLCSTNLLSGFRDILKERMLDQCVKRKLNCSDTNIANMTFQELDVSIIDIWQENALIDVEVQLTSSGSNGSVIVRDVLQNNVNSNDFQFAQLNSLFGSCVYIKHTSDVRYLSTATRLNLIINEPKLAAGENVFYMLIPHGVERDSLTSYEFLSNEFELIPYGHDIEFKFKPVQYDLKNTSKECCYDEIAENNRLKQCATEILDDFGCRLPHLPNPFARKECRVLNEIQDPYLDLDTINHILEIIGNDCAAQLVCEEKQYRIYIDSLQRGKDNTTKIAIKMADSEDVIQEIYDYTFPELVSDLFAYWGFFLSLSALVFVEIFEYICTGLCYCFKKYCKA